VAQHPEPYAAATGGRYVPVNRPLEGMGVADGSADMIVVARALHNWHRDGRTAPYMAAFFKALKPGGVLAIEQHRSAEGLNAARPPRPATSPKATSSTPPRPPASCWRAAAS
jgi:predicted methyltransferase